MKKFFSVVCCCLFLKKFALSTPQLKIISPFKKKERLNFIHSLALQQKKKKKKKKKTKTKTKNLLFFSSFKEDFKNSYEEEEDNNNNTEKRENFYSHYNGFIESGVFIREECKIIIKMTKEEDDDDEEIIIERLQRERRQKRMMNVDEKEEDKEDSFFSSSDDEEKKNDDTNTKNTRQKRRLKSFTMPANATKDFIFQSGGGEDDREEEEEELQLYREKFGTSKKISDRENEYKKRRFQRQLSPERRPGVLKKDSESEQKGGEESKRGYKEAMREQMFAREKEETMRNIERKREREREEQKRREMFSSIKADDVE